MDPGGSGDEQVVYDHPDAQPRSRPRPLVVLAGIVGVLALYLALTFAAPTVVPRLNMLPKPAATPTRPAGDGCNTTSDDWEKGTYFWHQTHWSTVASCLG